MNKYTRRLVSLLLILVLSLGAAVPALGGWREEQSGLASAYDAAKAYLIDCAETRTPIVDSVGGEWLILGLARAGERDSAFFDAYYENLRQYVKEHALTGGRLHRVKSTENDRVILALTAMGLDPRSIAGVDLVQGLSGMDFVKGVGINGVIWALIALDSGRYEIPSAPEGETQFTREAAVDLILEKQHDDGGWSLTGDTADTDMTGMALQALTPYVKGDERVAAAVERGVACLSGLQKENGGFSTMDDMNVESCAQAVTALSALGIDAGADERFVKGGVSLIDALLSFQNADGSFRHLSGDTVMNQVSTEQAFYALVAYVRFLEGRNSLYDMSDAEKRIILPFRDVKKGDWFYPAVLYAYRNQLFNGTSADTFSPDKAMNRAMLVTVLYRLDGGKAEGNAPFSDVPSGEWYSEAVAWAAGNGIVNGFDDGTFKPLAPVTRQQIAVILYRYAEKLAGEPLIIPEMDVAAAFPDWGDVAGWAVDGMTWACACGYINGKSGKLVPAGNATRAEVAMILSRVFPD